MQKTTPISVSYGNFTVDLNEKNIQNFLKGLAILALIGIVIQSTKK